MNKVNKSAFVCGYVHVDEVPRSNVILIEMVYPRILVNLGSRHIIHITITLYVSSSAATMCCNVGRHRWRCVHLRRQEVTENKCP